MCQPYLFHDTTSGDKDLNVKHDITSGSKDSNVRRDQHLDVKDLNVRKFSAKYQHLGLLKHAVTQSLHNRLTLLKTNKNFNCSVILVYKKQ